MSSFQKIKTQNTIPGTRVSIQNGQLITSCGNPSLDHIIGGGLSIGSIIMVEEDKFVTYSKVLAKYFLAEGIYSGHSTFLGSLDDDPNELMKKLPTPTEDSSSRVPQDNNPGSGDMRIAWRYNNLPKVNSEQSTVSIGHNFDLTKQISDEKLRVADSIVWDDTTTTCNDSNLFTNGKYFDLLQKISARTQTITDNKTVLRICITSLGSPNWYDENCEADFVRFLTILKSIVRSSTTVCLITVPSHLIQLLNDSIILRIRNLVDYCIQLESFAGSDKATNPVFKEYHGLLNIRKQSALNSLATFTPETTDLAFKLRRRKFIIEKLHLPPELQESEQHEQDDIVPTLSCGSICGSVLLFSGFYLFSDTQRILLSRLLAASSDQLTDLPQPLFYYIALGLGAAGTIAILAAVIGFWASCLNTYCFLSLYFLTVVVLLLAESAACLAITLWPQCLGLNMDEDRMVRALQANYGVPGQEQFTAAMDMAQTRFQCCGITSDMNYDTSMWHLQGYGQPDWIVPFTCCRLNNQNERFAFLDPKPLNGSQCQTLQKFEYEKARYTDSCLERIDNWYREQYVLFLGASLIVAIVEFCVLLAIILNCTNIPKFRILEEDHVELKARRKSQIIVDNIYQPDINIIPTDLKEIYIQPPDLCKNKHNTTFNPVGNQYHISRSYLV